MGKVFTLSFFLLLISNTTPLFSQTETKPEEKSLVKWLTFKEAFEKDKQHHKPFLIDVYTDWCGWCKHMMKTTYSDPNIANYINNWFYPVKFNAETKDTIEFRDKIYVNEGKESRSVHQLTTELLGNHLTYPSTLFMNDDFKFNFNYTGYIDEKKIQPILIYTVEYVFRTVSFDDFSKQFEKTFYDTTKIANPNKWHSFNAALELNKAKPKKLMVVIYTSWCNSCQVMIKTTFSDPKIAGYINKNYYLVDFNAESRDSISYNGQAYLNTMNNGLPFHPLALALTNKNLIFPSIVIIDEKLQVINIMPFYTSPENLGPVATFFGDNSYKKVSWNDYLKKLKEDEEKGKEKKEEKKKK
jgi:uncharacterized protein YyaL (SSP411 family)